MSLSESALLNTIASALWEDYGYAGRYQPWYVPAPQEDPDDSPERLARARCLRAAVAVVAALRTCALDGLREALESSGAVCEPDVPDTGVHDTLTPIEVWADGSGYVLKTFTSGGERETGPAGAGVVVVDHAPGVGLRGFGVPLGKGTNNVAELSAILYGLRGVQATGTVVRPVQVHSDSQYALGAASSRNRATANKELIAELQAEVARFRKITFHHVKGHSGVTYNELADKLAGMAAKDQRRVELSEVAFTAARPR